MKQVQLQLVKWSELGQLLEIPWALILLNNLLCSTLMNAFWKSKHIMSTGLPESVMSHIQECSGYGTVKTVL